MPQLKGITQIAEELQPLQPLINDLVDAVTALQQISAGAGLSITVVNGVPSISLDTEFLNITVGKLQANMQDDTADAVLIKQVINPDNGLIVDEEEGLEDPRVIDPMAKVHLADEILAMRNMSSGGLMLLPFTYWDILELTAVLDPNSTSAGAKVLKGDLTDSGETVDVKSVFVNHTQIAIGDRVLAIQHRESKEMILFAADCAP